jgi:hypothetical protein
VRQPAELLPGAHQGGSQTQRTSLPEALLLSGVGAGDGAIIGRIPGAERGGEREAERCASDALRGCGAEDDDVDSGTAAAASVARATKRATGRVDRSDDDDGGTGDCGAA